MNCWWILSLLLLNIIHIHGAALENTNKQQQATVIPYSSIYSTYNDPNGMTFGTMSATSSMNPGPSYSHSSMSTSNHDLGNLGTGIGGGSASSAVYSTNTMNPSSSNSNHIVIGSSSQSMPLERQGMTPQYTYAPQNGVAPPYTFKDPGFSVQTGFEGFLVRIFNLRF